MSTPQPSDVWLAYTSCGSRDDAKKLAAALLQDKLVACANIFADHLAVYEWQGSVEEEAETGMLLKTTYACLAALEKRLLELHQYDTPAFLAWPADRASPAFAKWIKDSVLK